MAEKIKVLFYTELWANAGVESVIMSLFRNMDLDKYSVDIMASQNWTDFYDDEIARLGGRKIITLTEQYSNPAKRMMANQNAFKKAIVEGKYDIVHLHMCNAASMRYGKIAKNAGVKVVAYHSHNTNLSTSHRLVKQVVHNVCKWRYEQDAQLLFSCSDLASQWMFTKKRIKENKVVLLKNAINLERFVFDKEERMRRRQELGLEDKFVVGHIGRFAVAKNHSYLIDIFDQIHQRESNAVLLLIGEGDDEKAIREKVNSLGLNKSVIFYGTTKEIPQMLWCMDAFVLPSLFEGNPVVGIEAQAASTPCFFADTITKMCELTDIVEYHSLEDSASAWAEEILKVKGKARMPTLPEMEKAGYDIKQTTEELQNCYEKALQARK